jgi:hypothetical protein
VDVIAARKRSQLLHANHARVTAEFPGDLLQGGAVTRLEDIHQERTRGQNQQFIAVPAEHDIAASERIVVPRPQSINQTLFQHAVCRWRGR